MQSFSPNVDGRSVAISMARISTAVFFTCGCFSMKFSLTSTAAALPSDVGLSTRERKKQRKENRQEMNRKVKIECTSIVIWLMVHER